MAMDVIDYQIFGDDIQYIEIELDPGEAAIGEAGAMMMMQDGIEMDTIFGDGSSQPQKSGLMGKLMVLAARLMAEAGVTGGFRQIVNTGRDGGQEVYHVHMHVIGGPRPWAKG